MFSRKRAPDSAYHILYIIVEGVFAQALTVGTAREPLRRVAGATPCQFHHIPTHPLQGMAEFCSQGGGTSGKVYLRKAQALQSEGENMRNNLVSTKVREEYLLKRYPEEYLLQALEQRFPCSPWWPREDPVSEQQDVFCRNSIPWTAHSADKLLGFFSSRNCIPLEELILEEGKWRRRK